MADDQPTDVPSFEDYSAAFDRLRRADAAGQDFDPADADVVRRGDATHAQQYNTNAAKPAPQQSSGPWWTQWQSSDPNSWGNIAKRGAINTLMAIPDLTIQGGNVLAHAMGDPSTVGMPSQWVREKLDVPEMGQDASLGQQLAEAALPIVAGSLPTAFKGAAALPGLMPKIEAFTKSMAKNAVLAPTLSYGGAAAGQEIGGEPGAFIGSIAAPLAGTAVLPPLAMRGIGAIHRAGFQAPETPYNTQMQQPGALEVGASAERLGVDPRFLMLANEPGKKMAQTMQSLGFTPSTRAMQEDRPMFEEQAANLIANRRALPDPTAETANLLTVARDARNQQILQQGVQPNEATSMPAIEQYMASKIGNPLVDVTDTANALKSMYDTGSVPGAPPGQQITPKMRDAIAAKYAELTTPAAAIGQQGGIASQVTPNGRIYAPWALVRGWRSGLGQDTQKAIALQGPQLNHAYGAITDDMRNAAAANGLHPAEFDAAMQIERNELGAETLKEKLLDPTLLDKSATYAANFGRRMQNLYEDPALFKRMMGGEYESKAAPAPTTAGDIRQQAADVGVLGRASYLPPEQTGQAQSLWRGARQELLLPGIGYALGTATGTPFTGTVLGVLGNYLRSGLSESPTVRNMMMGRPVPWVQAPSILHSAIAAQQQEKLRQAIFGERSVPKSSAPSVPSSIPEDFNPWPRSGQSSAPSSIQPDINPWLPASPRSGQSLLSLPTTSPILAAFNAARVGRSRAETAA